MRKWLLSSRSVHQSSSTDHVDRNMGMQMGCVGDRSRRRGKQTTKKRLRGLSSNLNLSLDCEMAKCSLLPLTSHDPAFSTCFSSSVSHPSTSHPNQNWSNNLDSFLYIHFHICDFINPTSFSSEIFFELMCSSFFTKTISLWSPSFLAWSPCL